MSNRVKPSFVIFDIRALWRSALMSKNYKWRLNSVWHRMLFGFGNNGRQRVNNISLQAFVTDGKQNSCTIIYTTRQRVHEGKSWMTLMVVSGIIIIKNITSHITWYFFQDRDRDFSLRGDYNFLYLQLRQTYSIRAQIPYHCTALILRGENPENAILSKRNNNWHFALRAALVLTSWWSAFNVLYVCQLQKQQSLIRHLFWKRNGSASIMALACEAARS